MKVKELRDLNEDDLRQKERSLKKELFELGALRKIGRVEKPHQFKLLRRTIARIETLLNERRK